MTPDQEAQLFQSLARSRLVDWLRAEEAKQLEVLRKNKDLTQLLTAQGHAAQIERMLKLLNVHTN